MFVLNCHEKWEIPRLKNGSLVTLYCQLPTKVIPATFWKLHFLFPQKVWESVSTLDSCNRNIKTFLYSLKDSRNSGMTVFKASHLFFVGRWHLQRPGPITSPCDFLLGPNFPNFTNFSWRTKKTNKSSLVLICLKFDQTKLDMNQYSILSGTYDSLSSWEKRELDNRFGEEDNKRVVFRSSRAEQIKRFYEHLVL